MDIEKIKQKILDLAIRGKLVPQDPNDEPASVLLEKIKAEKDQLVKEGKIKPLKNESYIYKGSDNCYYEKKGGKIKNISSEISFEIPDSWCWIRIDKYAQIITDFVASGSFASLRENVKYYKEENYSILVRTCDFNTSFSSDLVYTDKHGYDFLKKSNLFGGELLLPNIGASIGKVYIVPYLNTRMTLAPNSIMINTNDARLNIYLSYVFRSSYGQEILHKISFSSAQAKFNKTDFRKVIIPIPPYEEQIKIINKINEIETKINLITKSLDEINSAVNFLKSKILDYFFRTDSSYKSYYENEFKLGQILGYEQPTNYIVNSTDYKAEYQTPVLTAGKTFILGYTNEINGVYHVKKGEKVIIFDDFTTSCHLVDFDFKVKSSAMKILKITNKSLFDIDYIYFLLQTLKIDTANHKRYWIQKYAHLSFKIHTYEQQKEIVKSINNLYNLLKLFQ